MKRYIAIILLIITLFLTSCTPSDQEGESFRDVESSETGEGTSDSNSDNDDDKKTDNDKAKKTYTITYTNSDGGTISGKLVQQVVEGKDGTAVRAIPDDGYTFVDWSDRY